MQPSKLSTLFELAPLSNVSRRSCRRLRASLALKGSISSIRSSMLMFIC